jgi:hypothetical protein
MRRYMTLMGDVLAYGILIGWSRLGLWIKLLGFSVYHSRGDVWLPMPPQAIDFLMGMVLTAAFLFATFFLLASCLIFLFGRFSKAGGGHFLDEAFYGDGRKLIVKYFVFLSSAFITPLAIYSMWKIRPLRNFTIFTAFGIMLTVFIVIIFIADFMLSRSTPRQVSPKNMGATI